MQVSYHLYYSLIQARPSKLLCSGAMLLVPVNLICLVSCLQLYFIFSLYYTLRNDRATASCIYWSSRIKAFIQESFYICFLDLYWWVLQNISPYLVCSILSNGFCSKLNLLSFRPNVIWLKWSKEIPALVACYKVAMFSFTLLILADSIFFRWYYGYKFIS